jgi:hypothetical protein
LVLGLALAILGVTGSVLARSVKAQANSQVQGSAEQLGRNIVDLTARRDLVDPEIGRLSKSQAADLDGDVAQLGLRQSSRFWERRVLRQQL